MARKAAKQILTSYPDYGKAPPEYAIRLADFLSYLTGDEVSLVVHPRKGITSKTKFLPTHEEITSLLREHEEKQFQFKTHTHYKRFESAVTSDEPKGQPFQPYPKLTAAFREEPWLVKGQTFETLSDASRSMAMFGMEAARDVLNRRVGA